MGIIVVGGSMITMTMAVMFAGSTIGIVFMREQLGASYALLGLNSALWSAAVLLGLPGAWFFNRLRARRPSWVVLMAVSRSFLFVVALAALLSIRGHVQPGLVWLVIVANMACASLGSFASAAWWAWMADLIPESVRGHYFGRRYQVLVLASAVALVSASLILERIPVDKSLLFFWIFLVAAVLGVIDPILFWWVPEPARPPGPQRTFRETITLYLRPLKERSYGWLTWTAALQTLFVTIPGPFFVLYQRGDTAYGHYIGCGISLQFLAVMNVIWLVCAALVAGLWGSLADRIGHRTVYLLGNLSIFSTLGYFFMGPQNYWWLLPLQLIVNSLAAAGAPVALNNLMMSIAPQAQREYYVSTFWALVAGAGAIGPWIGGLLADALPMVNLPLPNGQPASYLHVLLVCCYAGTLVNLPLMLRIPDVRGEALLPWFARMISGGLFRTAWNITAIGGAGTPSRRIRALRGVRTADGNVVLNDLGQALEDPDPGVRREALLALGRVGTPEAVELLIWYLHEPDRQTRTASAEALGATGSAEGTVSLVGALSDDDSHVRRAAAEALGHLADARAAETLLNLLGREQDGEVLVSVTSALSRLREFRALRQMLAIALQNPNRMLRAQITVAMGDLLGPPGQFYRLWRRERRLAGSASAKLARRVRRQARALQRLRQREQLSTRQQQRQLLATIRDLLEEYVGATQQDDWPDALAALRDVSLRFLELQYDYRGGPESALRFLAAIDPILAERHWMLDYLERASRSGSAPEAPWNGLTLLAAWAMLHGQPPG